MRHAPFPAAALAAVLAAACTALAACDDDPVSSAPSEPRLTATARWNAVARTIVGRREMGPVRIARTFALVHVAQYDAVLAAEAAAPAAGRRAAPSGAAAGAAAAVLAALYPNDRDLITSQLGADSAYYSVSADPRAPDFAAGAAVGRTVATSVIARAAADRSDLAWTGTKPAGPGRWLGAPAPAQPLSPRWGEVRTWFLSRGDQVRSPAPPAFGSPEFQTALAEVRRYSDTRTPAQLAVAQSWGAVAGTAGPPGYWSEVALGLAANRGLGERATARVMAVLHMAGHDAMVGCWDAKYTYWYVRPFEADSAITTPVGRPNFPAYPSAHSCLSASAGGVLEGLFPEAAADVRARVAEAGDARVYGGMHFRFDVTAGQQLGASVAALALARAPRDGQPVPVD